MATLKREKTAIIFNTLSQNFILVVSAKLFSSHHSRVELLGIVLTPYKSESSHYGNDVWEGGEVEKFLTLIINRCIMRKVEIQLLHPEQSKAYLLIISLTNLAYDLLFISYL